MPANTSAQDLAIRGFADVGLTNFTAKESFEAVLGTPSGPVFGGGAEVVLPQRIFVGVRASRFRGDGERVFVFGGEVFRLGIDTTVTVTPVELTAGYRFGAPPSRLLPYAGGGVGWHAYDETSEFADESENVHARHTGYHLLGGVEVRISRWIAAAGEAQWATVPDALGQDPNAASTAFGDTDLGGTTFRIKIVIGR